MRGFKIIDSGRESYYQDIEQMPDAYKKIFERLDSNVGDLIENLQNNDKVVVFETENDKGEKTLKNLKIDNLYIDQVKGLLESGNVKMMEQGEEKEYRFETPEQLGELFEKNEGVEKIEESHKENLSRDIQTQLSSVKFRKKKSEKQDDQAFIFKDINLFYIFVIFLFFIGVVIVFYILFLLKIL